MCTTMFIEYANELPVELVRNLEGALYGPVLFAGYLPKVL